MMCLCVCCCRQLLFVLLSRISMRVDVVDRETPGAGSVVVDAKAAAEKGERNKYVSAVYQLAFWCWWLFSACEKGRQIYF